VFEVGTVYANLKQDSTNESVSTDAGWGRSLGNVTHDIPEEIRRFCSKGVTFLFKSTLKAGNGINLIIKRMRSAAYNLSRAVLYNVRRASNRQYDTCGANTSNFAYRPLGPNSQINAKPIRADVDSVSLDDQDVRSGAAPGTKQENRDQKAKCFPHYLRIKQRGESIGWWKDGWTYLIAKDHEIEASCDGEKWSTVVRTPNRSSR
jgi:hypothetical protein